MRMSRDYDLRMNYRPAPILSALLLAAAALPVSAADVERLLVIKDHRFDPAELKVPAGERIKLLVHNQDRTAEEFESKSMNREKLVPAGGKVTIFLGPLKPGRYEFVGEYHEDVAKGVVIAE
jgi:plastocyanin